jgi:hypothetical protein
MASSEVGLPVLPWLQIRAETLRGPLLLLGPLRFWITKSGPLPRPMMPPTYRLLSSRSSGVAPQGSTTAAK